jgi:tetratricopeptide (TPR) repeat protein
MIRRLSLVLACALIPAIAQAENATAEAKVLLDKAGKAFQAGDFATALTNLLGAYDKDPQPDLLYAIAQTEQKLGKCEDAIGHYEQYLATSPAAGAAKDTQEAIDACKAKLPPPEPVVAPQPLTPPAPTKPRDEGEGRWYRDALGITLIGTGVLAGAIGTVVYTDARSDLDSAETATNHAMYEDTVDTAHTKRNVSVVLMVGGGALIAGGVVRLVMRERAEKSSHVALVPTNGGAVFGWGGSW